MKQRCKIHPREELTEVEHKVVQDGAVTLFELLYTCERCPQFLSAADVTTGSTQTELALCL